MAENPYATFLRARWDELEVDARLAHYDGQRWAPEEEAVVAADKDLDPLLFLDRKLDATHAANWSPAFVLDDIAAKRKILDWHENWPVLVEQKAPPPTLSQDYDVNSVTYQLSSRIHWATEREYVKQFGTAPPTSPILVMLAEPFRDHPDHPENRKAT